MNTPVKQDTSMPWAQADYFYFLAVPLLAGVMIGWFKLPVDEFHFTLGVTLYWVIFIAMIWWFHYFASVYCYRLIAKWRPPLWAPTSIGPIIGGVFLLYPLGIYTEWGIEWFGTEAAPPGPFWFQPSLQWFSYYLKFAIPGVAVWVGFNYFFALLPGNNRFQEAVGEAPAVEDNDVDSANKNTTDKCDQQQQTAVSSQLNDFIAVCDGLEIQAIELVQAQENYIILQAGSEQKMVRYPLSKAIAALEEAGVAGFRIHRSYWVAIHAVEKLDKRNNKPVLLHRNGKLLPVSRTYLASVRQQLS